PAVLWSGSGHQGGFHRVAMAVGPGGYHRKRSGRSGTNRSGRPRRGKAPLGVEPPAPRSAGSSPSQPTQQTVTSDTQECDLLPNSGAWSATFLPFPIFSRQTVAVTS